MIIFLSSNVFSCHIFHKRCLSRWTRQNLNCPECRKRVHWRNTVKRLFANIDETEQDSSCTISSQELQKLNSDIQLQLSYSVSQVCVLKQINKDQKSKLSDCFQEIHSLVKTKCELVRKNNLQKEEILRLSDLLKADCEICVQNKQYQSINKKIKKIFSSK